MRHPIPQAARIKLHRQLWSDQYSSPLVQTHVHLSLTLLLSLAGQPSIHWTQPTNPCIGAQHQIAAQPELGAKAALLV